ncbi:MAG TPA: glutamate racemase [Candidatus Kapabacteria bacterium]|nr:glutamate racemase [Candidatus Kapabacteria bacterium]
MNNNERPIGVFDSGIGGLTVVHHLLRLLPNENIVYFGDTARVPYGGRSKEILRVYSLEDAAFLMSKNVKMIVIACNTVSAVGLEYVRARYDVPVLGVIIPGAQAAVRATKNKKIGVIGTMATVSSNSYTEAILALNPTVEVISQPCPLFVPLAEEGWTTQKATELIADEYLAPFKRAGVDTLVLGCTHYPLLHDMIEKVMGPNVMLVNPGAETAQATKAFLTEHNMLNASGLKPRHEFYVSDVPLKFLEVGERFLGMKLENVAKVDI